MPYEIDLGMPPMGYTVTAARDGETIQVQYTEFTSTEDGQHFISRLEGLPSDILKKVSAQSPTSPSQVDCMLVIARRDGKATVYLNELSQKARIRVARSVEAGSPVWKDDIVDVDRLELDIDIPSDAGVLFLFSIGWRKGLFYDFGPIGGPDPKRREFDCFQIFGQAYCELMFQERFRIVDAEWNALFNTKWFPFAGLRHTTIDSMLGFVRSGWSPDDMLDQIVAEVRDRIPGFLDGWRRHSSFVGHVPIFETAVERFLASDHVSCTGLLYPRIEGLLRTHFAGANPSCRPSSHTLADAAVELHVGKPVCLLLPHKFADFLRNVYFAGFDNQPDQIGVSRHSVAHGVAEASHFNVKSAVIGILVVQQLFYLVENKAAAASEEPTPVRTTGQ